MTDYWRNKLVDRFGPEVVVKCCRLHKGHYNRGRWGLCGACGRRPEIVQMTWEEADAEIAAARGDGDV